MTVSAPAVGTFGTARRIFRLHCRRSIGSLGRHARDWERLLDAHGEGALLAAFSWWAPENAPFLRTVSQPLNIFMKQSEEWIEYAKAGSGFECRSSQSANNTGCEGESQSAEHGSLPEISSQRNFKFCTTPLLSAMWIYSILGHSRTCMNSGYIEDWRELNLSPTAEMTLSTLKLLLEFKYLGFDESRRIFFLQQDGGGLTRPQIFEVLGSIISDQVQSANKLPRLWLRIGVEDCHSLLDRTMRDYRIGPFYRTDKTTAAVTHLLQSYSIPRARGIIATVAKDVLAIIQKDGFRNRGVNMIPSALISRADHAQAQGWAIYPKLGKWEEEPAITKVLFDKALSTGVRGFINANLKNGGL